MSLLRYEEIPKWYQDNEFIRTGYRAPGLSWSQYISSTIQIHNETGNIWTHVLASGFFWTLTIYTALIDPTLKSTSSRLMLCTYLTTSSTCFFGSVIFHTFMPKDANVYCSCMKTDMTGICLNVCATFLPIIHSSFYECEHFWIRLIYFLAVIAVAYVVIRVAYTPQFTSVSNIY